MARLERWNECLAKRLELFERVLVQRLEPMTNGLNIFNVGLFVWNVFECLPGLGERGKRWDYQ